MEAQVEFRYKIDEMKTVEGTEEKFYAAAEPKVDEILKIQRGLDGGLSILGNREGWIYLARICVEMAYTCEKDPAYHVHRTSEFEPSFDSTQDGISFFNISDKMAAELKRNKQ